MSQRPEFVARNIFGRMIFQAFANLVLQVSQDSVQQKRGFQFDLRGVNCLLIKKSRKYQPQQTAGDAGDGGLGGKIFSVEVIDTPGASVRFHETLGKLRNGQRHGWSIRNRRPERKRCGERPGRVGSSYSSGTTETSVEILYFKCFLVSNSASSNTARNPSAGLATIAPALFPAGA